MEGVIIPIVVLVGLLFILTGSDDDDNHGNWGGGCFA